VNRPSDAGRRERACIVTWRSAWPPTDRLVEELDQIDGVITLAVHRGESVKPAGDVSSAAVPQTARLTP